MESTNSIAELIALVKQYSFELVLTTVNHGKNAPLVVVFGWLGSIQKVLKKYAEWYSSHGFHCLLIPGPSVNFKLRKEFLNNITGTLSAIDKELRTKNPIFFHVFSNGGFLAFNTLIWAIEKNEEYNKRIVGVIFDSAPTSHGILPLIRAMTTAINNNIMRYFSYLIIVPYAILKYSKEMTGEGNQWFVDIDRNQIFKQCSLLYLYSKSDKICDYKYVDATVERLKKKKGFK